MIIFLLLYFIGFSYILAKSKGFRSFIVIAFTVRVVLSIIHIYDNYNLPDSGDGFGYMEYAKELSCIPLRDLISGINLQNLWIYPTFVAILMNIFNSQSLLIPSLVNIYFGISIIFVILKYLYPITDKVCFNNTALFLVFSISLAIYSSNLIREVYVVFFLVKSVVFYLKILDNNNFLIKTFIKSIFCLFIAASFHIGVLGVLIVYLSHIYKTVKKSRILLLTFSALFLFIFVYYFHIGQSKLSGFYYYIEGDTESITVARAYYEGRLLNRTDTYYTTQYSKTQVEAFLLSPLKFIEFIIRPSIFDIKAKYDIVKFINTLLILFMFYYCLKNMKRENIKAKFTIHVVIILFFIFSIFSGEMYQGYRHRMKAYPLLILTYSLVFSKRSSTNKKDNRILNY